MGYSLSMLILAVNSNEGVGAVLVAVAALVAVLARWLGKKVDLFDAKNTRQHRDNQDAAKNATNVAENSYSLIQSIDTRLAGIYDSTSKIHEDIGGIRQWQLDHMEMHARLENPL